MLLIFSKSLLPTLGRTCLRWPNHRKSVRPWDKRKTNIGTNHITNLPHHLCFGGLNMKRFLIRLQHASLATPRIKRCNTIDKTTKCKGVAQVPQLFLLWVNAHLAFALVPTRLHWRGQIRSEMLCTIEEHRYLSGSIISLVLFVLLVQSFVSYLGLGTLALAEPEGKQKENQHGYK